MNNKEIRWKQRMENLLKAYKRLSEVVSRYPQLSEIEKEGMIQRFEYTFELAWKTLKDYLESKGDIEKFPRDVIKRSFEAELITNGELWLEMLENRNMLSHAYDEAIFNIVVEKISGNYYNAIDSMVSNFKKQIDDWTE